MPPLPLAGLVGKAFFFDELPLGRPHPPRRWGGRLDFAKRLTPPPGVDGKPSRSGITVTASLTDGTAAAVAGALRAGAPNLLVNGRFPQDAIVTVTAEGEGAWTYMLGYDAGADCGIARVGGSTPQLAAAATWFSNGGHLRVEGAGDLLRGGGGGRARAGAAGETAWCPACEDDDGGDVHPGASPSSSSSPTSGPGGWALTAWGAATANDGAAQANSTACNLAEREVGFIVAPFTARTSTAAVALRLGGRGAGAGSGTADARSAFGGAVPRGPGTPSGGWAVEGVLDVQAMQSFYSVEAPVRLPGVRRGKRLGTLALRYASTAGVGLVEFTAGGPPLDTTCPAGTAAAAAGVAAGAGAVRRSAKGALSKLGRVKAFVKADAGPGRAWLGRPAFGLIVDRAFVL